MLTPALLEFLRSPNGAALLADAAEVADDPFAAERLRRLGHGAEAAAAAVEQARLRRRAAAKFAAAERMWFTAPLLEQASGELISGWRSRRCTGFELVGDLCTGLGGDLMALAARGAVLGIDRDPLALALAAANLAAVGRDGAVRLRTGTVPADVPHLPAAWVDPGRREGGERTTRLQRTSPRFEEVLSLLPRVPALGVKLSPAASDEELDSLLAGVPHERELLSVRGECRELALWLGPLAANAPPGFRRATLLPSGATLAGLPEPWRAAAPAGEWLLEPDAAVVRADLVGNLAGLLDAWPLDSRLAYLALPHPRPTPFGTLYRVEAPAPFSGRALAARLRSLRARDVIIKTRGAAAQPELLRERLRPVLKQGEAGVCPVVFITRLGSRAVMFLGERVEPRAE